MFAPKWAPLGNEILVLAKSMLGLWQWALPSTITVNADTGRMRDVLSEPWSIEAADLVSRR